MDRLPIAKILCYSTHEYDAVDGVNHVEALALATRPFAAQKAPSMKAPARKTTARVARAKTTSGRTKGAAGLSITLKAVFEQLSETHNLPRKLVYALLADFVPA
jgi:hypothetical protein